LGKALFEDTRRMEEFVRNDGVEHAHA
jgi:hypothetical protein